jgi:hypothetical protein
MSQELKSTAVGMVTGIWLNITTGNLILAVITAFLTGGAAYLGQLTIKFISEFIKSKIKQ